MSKNYPGNMCNSCLYHFDKPDATTPCIMHFSKFLENAQTGYKDGLNGIAKEINFDFGPTATYKEKREILLSKRKGKEINEVTIMFANKMKPITDYLEMHKIPFEIDDPLGAQPILIGDDCKSYKLNPKVKKIIEEMKSN